MKNKIRPHTFHIPVMGTGYTIDTPIKVAPYGITSVISIIDHRLVEQMREYHCRLHNYAYVPIHEKEEDSRARSITAYLNLVNDIVSEKLNKLKKSSFEAESEITKYFEMLPESSPLKQEYREMLQSGEENRKRKQERLRVKVTPGAIDVNIMTKLDKVNYSGNEALPVEYNDAHAALRGFANSRLSSSVVLSAGLNPRLYGYMATFDDFFPDHSGPARKKIILKVSDYRSALIQGKFLAKKGLWVSEFRIESGLNCGGHAFATDGYLLGPILQEFKENRNELISSLFQIYAEVLNNDRGKVVQEPPPVFITVQGGVGTYNEHNFLLDFYNIDSVGWGSPFLLVPEAVNIDKDTIELISHAEEEELYLSDVSPLGVPFNTVKGSTAELERQERIEAGKPGAPCLKEHLVFNTDFTKKPICTASRQYQKRKIKELNDKKTELDREVFKKSFNKIVEKTCLCVGLSNSVLLENQIEMYRGSKGIAVCPGPNMAYFSKTATLKEMVDHIYGKTNIVQKENRPHMFIKELKMYIDYLQTKVEECHGQLSDSQLKYFQLFEANLEEGICYYKELFSSLTSQFEDIKSRLLQELNLLQKELNNFK
ncbi:hypothetical protein WJR50_27345 [Catalinimonas sp. 4WD22]|uniref:hypothetical protein n=1 Tax=Catalinimonas locisalis TaxID=3133978 RepID=UPI003100D907